MSVYTFHQKAYDIRIPWKHFVKESCDSPKPAVEHCTYRLHFEGNDAKAAYEEIIHQGSTNTLFRRNKFCESNVSKNHNRLNNSTKAINVQSKKVQSHDNVIKVNVNAILKAIQQRDLKFLETHVTFENVNLCDEFGWTPLMSAAYSGYFEIVEFLLHVGANKKARERSGLTAAQLALKKNYLSIVALLKKKVNFPNDSDQITTDSSNQYFENLLAVTCSQDTTCITCNGAIHLKHESCSNVEFYCDICKANFKETTMKKHECSTLHIFNTKPKLSAAMYGISKLNKGYQMLLNSGWDEDSGLGPSGKGRKYPIKTLLKIDRQGLGQPGEKEARVTHFKSGDPNSIRVSKQKCLKKKDRENLLNREIRQERALRIALS